MSSFWVIDTKCRVLPESEMLQDGSVHYYGRSVVPADSKESAVDLLMVLLKQNDVLVEEVIAAVLYEDGNWKEDDEFEVQTSFEEASHSGEIEIGCFVSEKSLQRS